MDDTHSAKAKEIRGLARNFLDLAEGTSLPDYRAKLLETAARLSDAANSLEEGLPMQARCA